MHIVVLPYVTEFDKQGFHRHLVELTLINCNLQVQIRNTYIEVCVTE